MKRVFTFSIACAAALFPQATLADPVQSELALQTTSTIAQPAIPDELLDTERGGEAVVVSNQTLVAVSEGSSIIGDYSAGTVSLSDNALSNFNGIGNLVINTGAQNNLQSGMNVTINVIN